jgi:hypothetical protein
MEALPYNTAKEYVNIKRDKKAEGYMMAFFDELGKYAMEHGGKYSRNKYRIYLPYKGPSIDVAADDSASAGSASEWTTNRECIKNLVSLALEEKGQWIDKWDYIAGTVDVAFKDQQGNVKVRQGQKIGRIISKDTIPTARGNVSALDIFSNDPIRMGKSIRSAISGGDLWLVISNHAYDIAGMSTNRNWTSCMNIFNGINKEYVENDIKYGTLVVYVIDKNDTNINQPYGRVLIKPYKLQRTGYIGTDAAPIIYAPEPTVYSPYVGMNPIRDWLKGICQELQEGDGKLRSLRVLYNDNFHDKSDPEFHGRRRK